MKIRGKRKEKWMDAYFTVEASFIIPMVLVIFVLILYLGFFLYDRCLFSQDAYLLCFRGSILKEEEEIEEKVASMRAEQFGRKYFALDSQESEVSEDGKWIVMEGEASLAPAVFGRAALMPEGVWRISYRGKARKTDPVYQFRRYRRIRYLAQQVLQPEE